MCGILGYTHIARTVQATVLNKALKSLKHRGPDRGGYFTTPHISLGATRQRSLDFKTAGQPMISADHNTALVFDGQIYNHAELRDELLAEGARFQSRCDTEVILHAYLHWGRACFDRLRGMFAIALWSEREKRLLLARDRMGIKPLYYATNGCDLSFGSELKCIFADPGQPRQIDLDGLNCYLNLNYVPGPYTLVKGITKLMPGQLLEWNRGKIQMDTYVATPASRTPIHSLEEATEELDHLLRQSVGEQMAGDVAPGLWLSGGLDSASLLHYATGQSSQPLKTFSITFQGKSFDESRAIHQLTRQYGCDHTEFDLSPQQDLREVIENLIDYSDEPGADSGALPLWYLSQITRPQVSTALCGEGADELFGGYWSYQADRYHRALRYVPRSLTRSLLGCARLLPASNGKGGLDDQIKRFLEGSMMSAPLAHVFWNGTFTEAGKLQFFPCADALPLRMLLRSMRRDATLERFLNFDQRFLLPDANLYKLDRMSMAHALQVRTPFLDERIVRFATQLPLRFKVDGRATKVVLRELMRGKLPENVRRRARAGLNIPLHGWLRGPLRPLLEETLNQSNVEATGLFYWPAIERLIHEHLERRNNWGTHLWGLVMLQLWMKRWQIEAPERQPLAGADAIWTDEVNPAAERYAASISEPA